MSSRIVTKNLAVQQDILFGEGEGTQQRAGGTLPISKVRVIYPVNSVEELEELDPEQFPKARLYQNNTTVDYSWNGSTYVVVQDNSEELVKALLIAQGYSGKYGFFEYGFTYTSKLDIGIDTDGNMWTTNKPIPHVVAAGTVPSEGEYAKVTLGETTADNTILASGLSIQEFADNRNITTLMGPAENLAALPNKVMIQKLRNEYPEFCVYTPMTTDNSFWHRWLFTNRFNVGNGGATRMINCSLAALNPSVLSLPIASNNTTEETASNTTATRASSTATTTGTWVGPIDTLGTTDALYSETIGDVLTFTITGVERIVLRGLQAGNGGIGKVQIFAGSNEISEENYLTPADRLVSFIATGLGTTTMHFPIAENLDKATSYTIEVRVHTSNPSGGRVYTAGILGYDNIAYDAVGYHGLFLDSPIAGESSNVSLTNGTAVVYEVTDATKFAWRYVSTSVSADCTYVVYSDTGEVLDSGDINGFTSSLTSNQKQLASNLTKGTYYFKIVAGKTKNTLATEYRMYDAGSIAYDQTRAGIIGEDTFDNFDVPNSIADPNNGSEYMLIGSGNLELAVGVRRPSDEVGMQEFVGGIHAYEEVDPIQVFIDGVEYDYESSDVLDTAIGGEINIKLNTKLLFPEDSLPFMNVLYDLTLSQSGYGVKTTKETIAPSVIHNDFDIMFNCPSTAETNQGLSVGGGFELVAADNNYLIDQYDNGGTFIKTKQGSVAFSNRMYTALCYYNRPPEYPEVFSSEPYNQGLDFALIQDRTDRTIKWYTRSFSGNETTGVEVPSGLVWTTSKVYRVMKGNFKNLTGL